MSCNQVDISMESEKVMLDNAAVDLNDDANDVGNQCEEESNQGDEYGDPGEEHEFEIIDQIESEEDDGNGTDKLVGGLRKDNQDDYSSSSDDLDDTELHAMLEKGIDKDSIKKPDENQDGRPIIKHKIVLNELESDPFDILPEGWVWVTHNCGMPVYLHKETRVCTMARPYSLGAASARTHDIPISAIPCLQYRRQMDKLKTEKKAIESCQANDISIIQNTDNGNNSSENSSALPMEVGNGVSCLKQPTPSSEKKSPGKVWIVTQESEEFKSLDYQHGALHTGVADYKTHQHSEDRACETLSAVVDENIAVSYDPSSLDQPRDEPVEEILLNSESDKDKVLSTPCSSGESEANTQTLESQHNVPTLLMDQIIETSSVNAEDAQPCTKISACPYFLVNSSSQEQMHLSSSVQLSPSFSSFSNQTIPKEIEGNEVSTKLSIPAVVTEEATSNNERSELVTSNTNPLASIKRKIESLKNRRSTKQRKLDNGSAVGWPTENNIAVSAMSSGRADIFNGTPHIPNADEKLKAHAAEVKIKSAEERAKESLLDSSTVHSYCKQLFQFKTLEVKKYRSWRERRKHLGERSRRNRPELPPSTKLITCPIPGHPKADGTGDNSKKREFILNPTGKSYLCILHEYMQRTLKIQPLYVFKELENSKTPYGATVMINNIEYGTGYASSKKVAKQEAAKETLKVLIPDLFKKITDQEIKRNISDLSFFDDVKVSDPRVNELGNKVGQPSPFQLLLECLRRNFGMGNTQCEVSTKPLKNQKCEFTINVGKHSATVVAKNKREGKQLAAQAILAKLHPHVPSWGSLLRLYGTSVEKAIQKPEEMNDVKSHAPNHTVLESLREEMKKLHRQKEAIQSKGKMIISSKDLPSKMSGVDL